jgi:multidrug efflux pump subunit AcrA (membrane-fusion protein)
MYVKVRIPIDASVPLLCVPLSAVRPRGEVWVVREGRLAIVPVEVARKENDMALLRMTHEGLQAGERVITSPLAAVETGMPVRDLTAAAASRVTAGALVKVPDDTKNTDGTKGADGNGNLRTDANHAAEGARQTTEGQQ